MKSAAVLLALAIGVAGLGHLEAKPTGGKKASAISSGSASKKPGLAATAASSGKSSTLSYAESASNKTAAVGALPMARKSRCHKLRPICEKSKKCKAVQLVKKKWYIDYDNIKSAADIANYTTLRKELRGKHLRIRSSRNWFDVAGFFTYPIYVVNQILLAKKLGFIGEKEPFVYMPETQHYFDECAKSGKQEFWTTWFKPISRVRFQDVAESDVWEFDQLTIESLHHNKDAVHSYPYQMHNHVMHGDVGTKKWAECHRARAQPFVDNYIDVRQSLRDEAANYYSKTFGRSKKVLGVHMRGTDKWINKKVEPREYDDAIHAFLKLYPKGKVFLATDDPKYLKQAEKEYGASLVVRKVLREEGNVFFNDKVSKDRKCRDVLLDSLILSKTDELIKPWSGVSEFSIYFHKKYSISDSYPIFDLQLNSQKNADATSTCSDPYGGPAVPESELAASFESGGDSEANARIAKEIKQRNKVRHNEVAQFHREAECAPLPPRMYSKEALGKALKSGACSRRCASSRSRHMGVEPNPNMKGNKTVLLVVSREKEDLAWIDRQPYCYVIMETEGTRHAVGQDDSFVTVGEGKEASSFLKFMADNMENLPDHLIAVGADREAPYSGDLVSILHTINPDAYEYASLNGVVYPMLDQDTYCNIASYWTDVIGSRQMSFAPFPRNFMQLSMSCCGQFIVSKNRILRNSQALYQSLFEYSVSASLKAQKKLGLYSFLTLGGKVADVKSFSPATYSLDEQDSDAAPQIQLLGVTAEAPSAKGGQKSAKGAVKKGAAKKGAAGGAKPKAAVTRRKLKAPPLSCRMRSSIGLSSEERREAVQLTWHVLFGEEWRSPRLSSYELCGSASRCPQNIPLLTARKNKTIASKSSSSSKKLPAAEGSSVEILESVGLLENARDPFWYPATEFVRECDRQVVSLTTPNQLISTPMAEEELNYQEALVSRGYVLPIQSSLPQPEQGIYNLEVDEMGRKPVAWFSDLLANMTVDEPEFINVLLYNDDPCGVDFYGLRAQPYLRFDGCGTPLKIFSSRHRSLIDKMDIVLISQGWSERIVGEDIPAADLKKKGQIWASCSVENGVTYPMTPASELRSDYGVDYTLATTKDADIPLTFYSNFYIGKSVRAELRSIKPIEYSFKIPKVVVMQAACKKSSFDFRTAWVNSFVEAARPLELVDSLGGCWHNANPRAPWRDNGMGLRPMAFHQNKMANVRPYMFTLCHESINRTDWITEKVFHALAVGSVPIYRGSNNVKNVVPCKNCVIDANDFKTPGELADYLNMLTNDEEKYNEFLAWKSEPYDPKRYPQFEAFRKKSIDTGLCRLAKKAPANAYRYKATEKCDKHCVGEMYGLHRVAAHG